MAKTMGLKIGHPFETQPLGTAGPLAQLIDRLKDDFLVMNGDLLTTLNYRRLYEYHRDNHAAATIGLYEREVKIDFGVVNVDSNHRLTEYIEKPTYKFNVSMGINVINPEIARPYLVPGKYLDLPDLMMKLHEDGHKVLAYNEPCYWLDIGRVDDYQLANEIFETRKSEFMPDGRTLEGFCHRSQRILWNASPSKISGTIALKLPRMVLKKRLLGHGTTPLLKTSSD